MKTLFSLIRSNGVIKKYVCSYTDFKNVHMTSVKSAPKIFLPKNAIFLGLRQIFHWLNSFLAKSFFGRTMVICTFLNQYEKEGAFLMTSSKKKVFIS